jgi:hypothetical protein
MSPIRKLLLVGVGVIALHGLQACASETELNPQPLPPQGGAETGEPAQTPGDKASDGSGGSSGSSGSGGSPPPVAADAGADGGPDASDGGTD